MNSKFLALTISMTTIIGMTQVVGACTPHLMDKILTQPEIQQVVQEVQEDEMFNEAYDRISSQWIEKRSDGASTVANQTYEIVEQYTGEVLPDEVKEGASKVLSQVEQEIMPNAAGVIGGMIDEMMNIQ